MKNHSGNTVFLTGASSGIGQVTAELLAKSGIIVYAASRNPANLDVRKFEGGGEIHPVTLDVRETSSVDAAAELVLNKADVGIVIHCAGIGIACAGEEYPEDAVSDLMKTNFDGVLRVNSRFLPHLRKRGCGLCIIVGSVAGVFSIPYQSHYSASKAALDSYAMALRMELRRFGVQVCLVMPGDTKTGFTEMREFAIDESSPFYEDCIRAVKKMEKDETDGKPPATSAKIIFNLCSRKNPPARKVVGFDYKMLVFLRRFLPERTIELLLRKTYLGL